MVCRKEGLQAGWQGISREVERQASWQVGREAGRQERGGGEAGLGVRVISVSALAVVPFSCLPSRAVSPPPVSVILISAACPHSQTSPCLLILISIFWPLIYPTLLPAIITCLLMVFAQVVAPRQAYSGGKCCVTPCLCRA